MKPQSHTKGKYMSICDNTKVVSRMTITDSFEYSNVTGLIGEDCSYFRQSRECSRIFN